MASALYLAAGDETATDKLDLLDATKHRLIGQIDAPPAGEGERRRVVTLSLRITGTDMDKADANRRAIERKLSQASEAFGPYGQGTGVALAIQAGGTEYVYFDVERGTLTETTRLTNQKLILATLELVCLPYARGVSRVTENLLTAPIAFDNAAWTKANASITANAIAGPDGSTTADKLVESAVAGVHFARQNITSVIGVTYAYSEFVKAGERTQVRYQMDDGVGNVFATADINLTTGVTSGVTGTIYVQPYSNSWWRLTLIGTATTTTTRFFTYLHNGVGTNYTGDGTSGAYVWGAQVAREDGPSPLMVPSGTTTATTNGDGGWVYLFDVPGDVDALCRWTLADSGTAELNQVAIGRRSLPHEIGLAYGEYDGTIDGTLAAGATETSDASAVGGSYMQVTTVQDWAPVALFDRTAGGTKTNGLLDVIARVSDAVTDISAPTGLGFSALGAAGYAVRASGVDSFSAEQNPTVSWSTETRRGSFLVMLVGWQSSATLTTPTGWTAGPTITHAGNAAKVAIFYIANSAPRSGAETLAFSATVTGDTRIWEVVGAQYLSPVDLSETATASTASSISDTTATLAEANEIVFAVAADTSTLQPAYSSGFSGAASQPGVNRVGMGRAYSVSTTGQADTFTGSGNQDWALAHITVLKETNAVPAMPAGSYTIIVVPHTASAAGAPSDPLSASLSATGALYVAWDEPLIGTVDHYRIYFKRDTQAWKYFATASGTTPEHYVLVTETGATTADPPASGTTETTHSEFRYCVAVAGTERWFCGEGVPSEVGGSDFEYLYLSAAPHPPIPRGETETSREDWTARIEARNADSAVTAAVDAIWLLPADEPQVRDARVRELDNATNRDWIIETNRYGRTFGRLYATGTTTVVDQLDVDGGSYLGAGNNVVLFVATTAGLVSDVTNLTFTPRALITPRYRWVAGLV